MQIFVIHGGDAFATYEEYLQNLKTTSLDLEKLKSKGWKSTLPEALGESYEVISPRMPNAQNAKYAEWKIWFEKHIPFMQDGVVLVGHSLGGVFLAKYLSENKFPKKIRAVFIVAAPYDRDYSRPLVEFAIERSLKQFAEQGGEMFFYHSKDDPIVEFSELEKYRKELPTAHFKTFEDRQHFHKTDEFPELVADIKKLNG
jgi:predicted alpha/beta hydrolase family esterase